LGYSQDFSNEDFIYLKRHEHIKIGLAKQSFEITKLVSEQAEYLSANKLYFANESMSFDSFTSIEDIDAYTYLPSSDKNIKVDYIETKREFDNGIFYSDQESKIFTFPAVTKGAITNLNYKEVIKDPHFLGLFRFGTYVPTKSAQLSIEFPNNVSIGYIDFNTKDISVDFKQETSKDITTYTWTANNTKGYQSEDDGESVLYFVPHIIVYIKSYEYKGERYNVLNDVNDLYKWYASLVDQIDTNDLQKVYKIANDITKSLPSKREKAEAIFHWVQNNINYVAFEDGLGGFIPRGAASVCDKRYGDCKDMANLLYEMLNHVGIEAYRTWIGTRDRPYTYSQVPTPMVDNHMITTAIIDGETIFLDGTDSYVPFGMPSAFTQTKEALLGINSTTFKLITVPVQKAEQSVTDVNTAIHIKDDMFIVTEKRLLSGYEKVEFITDYLYKKATKTEEEFLNTTLALGNNKTSYNNITKQNFDNKINPLELSYNLTIDNYVKKVGTKLYINLDIDRVLSKSKVDIEDKKYDKKIDHTYTKNYVTTLTIPEGYTASFIPEDLSFENENYGYKITYTQKDNTIIQHKNIFVNTLSVKKQDFESWNEFIKSLIKAYKKSIILEQK
jgi:transglutaminase-like putative cysteine protease